MLDFRRRFWALGLGAAVVSMLVPASVILAQSAVAANDNKVVLRFFRAVWPVSQSP
jgi:hypothetical protein